MDAVVAARSVCSRDTFDWLSATVSFVV
jgi:hypothetical protein